jgi:UDP-N-acetylmuramoyl-tripeptide--D-alanyl-D-alanine ligase
METTTFQPQLTPEFLVRALRLRMPSLARAQVPFTGIDTDSRNIEPGSLFVALKGENFDGHDFIESAVAKGARGVLCQRGKSVVGSKDATLFYVEDTLRAYRKFAAAWRKEFSIPVIAIAGSAGKTTTKELLASILTGKWKHILKTQGSQNGFVGIPMTLLELGARHDIAIIEIGIDDVGAMEQHIALVSPGFAILTSIGPEHLENLIDVPTVAQEEGIALSWVSRNEGTVAVNMDDSWIRPHLTAPKEGRKVPYSLQGLQSHLEMISGRLSPDGRELIFSGLGLSETQVPLPLPGKHNASNLLGAIALAAALGLKEDEIRQGLATFQGEQGRSQVKHLPGNILTICDYYNAQPASMNAALDLVGDLAKRSQGATWVCLADMLELGHQEEELHRNLATKIKALNIQNVLLLGTRMKALENELTRSDFRGKLEHFSNHGDMASALIHSIQEGDLVLIKGSRSMKMEEIWKTLEPFALQKFSK